MTTKTVPCISCGQPSTRLCDFCIGWPIAGFKRVGAPSENRFMALVGQGEGGEMPLPFTCDAPICNACTRQIGLIHFSGKDAGAESIDRCPQHADNVERERIVPMMKDEADAIRRDVWAAYRRKALAQVVA